MVISYYKHACGYRAHMTLACLTGVRTRRREPPHRAALPVPAPAPRVGDGGRLSTPVLVHLGRGWERQRARVQYHGCVDGGSGAPPPRPQVNVPKAKKNFCKKCKKHSPHKVTQYKTGKASLYAQGTCGFRMLFLSRLGSRVFCDARPGRRRHAVIPLAFETE